MQIATAVARLEKRSPRLMMPLQPPAIVDLGGAGALAGLNQHSLEPAPATGVPHGLTPRVQAVSARTRMSEPGERAYTACTLGQRFCLEAVISQRTCAQG